MCDLLLPLTIFQTKTLPVIPTIEPVTYRLSDAVKRLEESIYLEVKKCMCIIIDCSSSHAAHCVATSDIKVANAVDGEALTTSRIRLEGTSEGDDEVEDIDTLQGVGRGDLENR